MSEDLPEGWTSARIAEVFDVNPRKPAADHVREHTPVSFVPMSAVDADRGAITEPEERTFGALRKGYTAFADGDVLLAKITPCFENGKAAVASSLRNGLGFGSSEFHVFRPQGAVLAHYLFYFLRQPQLRAGAAEFMTGTAGQARVPIAYLRDLVLPIAPLAEQRRIVAKVEALLERVRRAKDRLDRVPLILRRFRQAVLAAACSGELTAQWRNCRITGEPATELLTRLASEREEEWRRRNPKRSYRAPKPVAEEELPSIPESWAWTNFDHCAWEITVGHVGPMKHRYVERGIPFLRSQNVRPLRFNPANSVFVDAKFHSGLHKSRLLGGEILVTRSGANTGDCCVYPAVHGEANCSDLVITRPLSGLVPEYGAIYVASPEGQARIGLRETGMAQPHFNIGAMRVKAFPLPPFNEQGEIVRRVDALFALAATVERRVQGSAARAGNLPQSILSKAFACELVPSEADLARAESRAYETAGQLLKRVLTQPAEPTTTRKRARPASSRGRFRRTSKR